MVDAVLIAALIELSSVSDDVLVAAVSRVQGVEYLDMTGDEQLAQAAVNAPEV